MPRPTPTPTRRRLAALVAVTAAGLLRAAPAAAEPRTVVPGRGDSVVENAVPAPAVLRPQTQMVWEDVEIATVAAQVNSHIIYLNRCIGGCEVAQGTTNATSDPPRSSLGHGLLGAFSRSDTVWNTVVECMREVYAPFNVELTEIDPGALPHFEIMFGGIPQQLGMQPGIGGVSPFACVPYIPNSLVFVFDVWGDNAEEICATAAQEIAHSFALDHAIEPSDPMTYFAYQGRRRYVNAQIQCGSDCDKNARSPLGVACSGPDLQQHVCACGDGAQTQNDVQIISALFGETGATPPIVKITSPRVGDKVGPGFVVAAEIRDDAGVTSAEMRVDDELIGTLAGGPFEFTGPHDLADGTHTIIVTGYDDVGAPGRARIQVIVGPGCRGAADCPTETDSCIAGRCVAGPGAPGGLGAACLAALDCTSWQCANDNGARYCVESCSEDQCPDGFGCRPDGAGGGVCWPGFREGFAGCAAGMPSPPLASIALGLGFALVVVRRQRPRR
jgi:Bacterial Ig domain